MRLHAEQSVAHRSTLLLDEAVLETHTPMRETASKRETSDTQCVLAKRTVRLQTPLSVLEVDTWRCSLELLPRGFIQSDSVDISPELLPPSLQAVASHFFLLDIAFAKINCCKLLKVQCKSLRWTWWSIFFFYFFINWDKFEMLHFCVSWHKNCSGWKK